MRFVPEQLQTATTAVSCQEWKIHENIFKLLCSLFLASHIMPLLFLSWAAIKMNKGCEQPHFLPLNTFSLQ